MWNALLYHLLSLVCLFTFSFFFRGRGGGRFFWGPSLSLCLEGPKVRLGRLSLCIYVCFLCNSCLYICSVSVVMEGKNLKQKNNKRNVMEYLSIDIPPLKRIIIS